MNTTIFLAQLWGPAVLAVGLGILLNKEWYKRLYIDIQKEPLAVLTIGILLVVVATLQISYHNSWGKLAENIITTLGWATLLKGLVFLIAPRFVDKVAEWEMSKGFLPVAVVLTIGFGAYLTWFGFFA